MPSVHKSKSVKWAYTHFNNNLENILFIDEAAIQLSSYSKTAEYPDINPIENLWYIVKGAKTKKSWELRTFM
ncbi:10015_t:CDS:2, partial [Funneliformis geosporum]